VIVLALINLPDTDNSLQPGTVSPVRGWKCDITFSTVSVIVYYLVTQRIYTRTPGSDQSNTFRSWMSMGIALTFSNARAVLEAVLGIKTPLSHAEVQDERPRTQTWV